MLLESSPVRFSIEEVSQSLRLPKEVIDALAHAGLIDSSGGTLSAATLERLLRDTLLRLYRAEARAGEVEIALPERSGEIEIELEPDEALPDPDLVRQSLADYQREARTQRKDTRLASRYKPRRQLGGTFRQARFTILQISETGLRIRHDETLRPGDEARLAFSLVQPARTFALQARVVWTSIAQRGSGPSFCISGLCVTAGEEQLTQAIRVLLALRELEADDDGGMVSKQGPSLPDDDVAAIIRTQRMLTSDPVEANRWYSRARFALADETIRAAAPTRARDREEALAVWEYLGRRIDLKAVAGVLSWIRSTRSAAAAPAY